MFASQVFDLEEHVFEPFQIIIFKLNDSLNENEPKIGGKEKSCLVACRIAERGGVLSAEIIFN